MKKFLGNKLAICIFTLPTLILFTLFVVYPIFPEVIISLHKNDGFRNGAFVGLSNYKAVLQSHSFWKANNNTFLIVGVAAFIGIPISLLMALLIDVQVEWLKRFFKATIVFPAVLSVTVISQMWVAIYEPEWGLLNSVLKSIGLGKFGIAWLSDEKTVVVCIAIAFIWQYLGLNALLFYTGIKTIPKTYYEAALIDGAGFFKCCMKITIPLLQEMTKYVLILSILGSMSQFAHVRIMTSGGPGDASRTVIYQLYYTAFSMSDFGQGSATAVLFIIECLAITFLINRFVAREKIEF